MSLNDGDKAEIKEIAREIVKEVLIEHVKACPWGVKFYKIIFLAVGIGIGSGVGTGALFKYLIGV